MQVCGGCDGQLEVMGGDWVGCTETSPSSFLGHITMKTESSHLGCWAPSFSGHWAQIAETEEKFLADDAVFRERFSLSMRCLCDNITVLTQDKGSHGSVAEAMGLGSLPRGSLTPLLLSKPQSLSPFSQIPHLGPVKYAGLENPPHLRDFSTNPRRAPSHPPILRDL